MNNNPDRNGKRNPCPVPVAPNGAKFVWDDFGIRGFATLNHLPNFMSLLTELISFTNDIIGVVLNSSKV